MTSPQRGLGQAALQGLSEGIGMGVPQVLTRGSMLLNSLNPPQAWKQAGAFLREQAFDPMLSLGMTVGRKGYASARSTALGQELANLMQTIKGSSPARAIGGALDDLTEQARFGSNPATAPTGHQQREIDFIDEVVQTHGRDLDAPTLAKMRSELGKEGRATIEARQAKQPMAAAEKVKAAESAALAKRIEEMQEALVQAQSAGDAKKMKELYARLSDLHKIREANSKATGAATAGGIMGRGMLGAGLMTMFGVPFGQAAPLAALIGTATTPQVATALSSIINRAARVAPTTARMTEHTNAAREGVRRRKRRTQ